MLTNLLAVLRQSSDRISGNVIVLLPGLLALIIVISVSLLIAWLVRAALLKVMRSMNFDQRSEELGFGQYFEWSPTRSPSLAIARLAQSVIVLLGLLLALTAFDPTLTSHLTLSLFQFLPNLLAAILILIVGTFVARFVARSVLISAVNMQIQSARLLSMGVKWLVLVLAGAMALEHLGIGRGILELAFGILFGGIVLALSLAVGLGSKEMVSRSWERSQKEEPREEFHHF
jgi:hypothetical protein